MNIKEPTEQAETRTTFEVTNSSVHTRRRTHSQ